jgi:hypothetical protein
MRFVLTEDQRLLRDAFAEFLAREPAAEQRRAHLDELAGMGLDGVAMALLCEQAGRFCLPEPLGELLVGDDSQRRTLLAAAELVGAGQAVVEMGRDHALTREQFGKPIGAFQAVKHHLASALVRVTFARSAVYAAAWSLTEKDVSMAKALSSDAGLQAARAALQVHGAIGYTDEHHLHRWLERIWTLAAAWGDAARHRDRLAGLLLG